MSGSRPAADGRPSLVRRGLRRARRTASGLRRIGVRQVGADAVRVARRRYALDDPNVRCAVSGLVTISVSDPAAFVRLAISGVLRGTVRGLSARIAVVPEWLVFGLRPPALRQAAASFAWRRAGEGLAVDLRWSRAVGVDRALSDVLAAVLRPGLWPQSDGEIYALDRTAWLDGASSWPQGHLGAIDLPEYDDLDRPLGPFQVADRPKEALPPVFTAVANPVGRKLVGAATKYVLDEDGCRVLLRDGRGRVAARLDAAEGVEAGLLRATFDRYAVATVNAVPAHPHALRSLAACGVVFAAADPTLRAHLVDLGLVTVADPAEVDDLRGYALSAAASRNMAVNGDAALRRTVLGDGPLVPPTVSIVLSSMRARHVEDCLGFLAAQTYPALEVVVGLHGYDVPQVTAERWREIVPYPLRVVPFPVDLAFGAVLGGLSRAADGDLLTKVDDDDHYGPHHVTDLVIAARATGADVVAKGARFVHLQDRSETIDREWAADEGFGFSVAGGTLLVGRGTLQRAGGWSHSSRHVDADLLSRIRSAGGAVYRTHALEYVYVRHSAGHTFDVGVDHLLDQGRKTYTGLPEAIVGSV